MDDKVKTKNRLHNNTLLSTHYSHFNLSSYLPPSTNHIIAKGDSGATQHYFSLKAAPHLLNVTTDKHGPTVTLPNNQVIKATHSAHLPLSSSLSPSATKTSLFPQLHNNLISIGQLCDDDCHVNFTKHSMQVTKNNKSILKGVKSTTGNG